MLHYIIITLRPLHTGGWESIIIYSILGIWLLLIAFNKPTMVKGGRWKRNSLIFFGVIFILNAISKLLDMFNL